MKQVRPYTAAMERAVFGQQQVPETPEFVGNQPIRYLYAFYDGTCGLCGRCRTLLMDEPQLVPIFFLPYQSAEVQAQFPGLAKLNPDREIVVIEDTNEVYQGEAGWIALLWATEAWRGLSLTLSSPMFRGLAGRAVSLISENRQGISKWIGLRPGGTGKVGELEQLLA